MSAVLYGIGIAGWIVAGVLMKFLLQERKIRSRLEYAYDMLDKMYRDKAEEAEAYAKPVTGSDADIINKL